MSRYFLIDPGANVDYTMNWEDFFEDSGSPTDSISTSTWSVTPQEGSPLVPTLSNDSNTATTTTTFIADCQVGVLYQLTNRIVTTLGRTDERSITLRCEQR